MNTSNKPTNREALEQSVDFLVQETMKASDEEILREVRDDYGDENRLADEAIESFKNAWRKVRGDEPLPVAKSTTYMSGRRKDMPKPK